MEILQSYWLEFLTIAIAHLVAVASPGPDFAVVLKNSVSYGRRAGVITSIGVGLGILLHVAYSLAGIGILIKTTPWLFSLFSYAAAGYLSWIGIQGLRSQPSPAPMQNDTAGMDYGQCISDKKAFWTGFLTNGLNPKATLFFLSLYALIVNPETPMTVKAIYGLYMTLATGIWFSFLSFVVSSKKVRAFIGDNSHWFDRIMGITLIALAIKLLTSG